MVTKDAATLHLAAVVTSSDDAIISTDLDGTIESWNPAAERLFGYTPRDAIGQSIHLIVPPERRDAEDAMLYDVRNGRNVHDTTWGLRKNGTLLELSVSISAVRTPEGEIIGISKIARDITGERQLERQALRLAAIVKSSDDAIVSKDLDGTIRSWNPAAEKMFGYTEAEAIGKSIRMIIPPDRQAEEDDVLRRVREGVGVDHFETIRRRKDGTLINISLSVSPIRNSAGQIIGASKIARDITVQKQLAQDLEHASRLKDEFLATLSHELRTPLNALLGYTQMLRSGSIKEERQDRAFELIERNAHILAQLVSDVLDMSMIVAEKTRLNLKPCVLATIVDEAIDIVRPAMEAKHISVTARRGPMPEPFIGDPERLRQVFWNLLTNAVKFTPEQGNVAVAISSDASHATVTVTDSGIGIKAESLSELFQRFRQVDSGPTRASGGLGLGLALARHFAELHGGTVTAASDGLGRGATFTVVLPVHGVQNVPA